MDLRRDRCRQERLTHTVGPDDRHERARARGGALPVRAQATQLAVPSAQRNRGRRGQRGGEFGGRRLDGQRRVLAQDGVVQAPQLQARLDPDLFHQRAPGVPVGLECLSLATAAIERDHLLRVQPLTQRVLGQDRLDVTDDLLVATRGEVSVNRQLARRRAQLPEATDLSGREGLIDQVGERLAAKQGQRFACCGGRLPGSRGASLFGHEPFEPLYVHRLRIDPQLVPAVARDDLRTAVGQSQAQAPDVILEHLGGAPGRLLAPHAFDQAVGSHRAVGLEDQHRQNRALLRPAECDRPVADADLEVAEEPDLHARAIVVARKRAQPHPSLMPDQRCWSDAAPVACDGLPRVDEWTASALGEVEDRR